MVKSLFKEPWIQKGSPKFRNGTKTVNGCRSLTGPSSELSAYFVGTLPAPPRG